MNNLELKCVRKGRISGPAARWRSGFLAAGLGLVSCALWPATARAQSFTSTGTITASSSTASPYPSAISVTGLSGTLTALTLTFTNFSVSNANSLAIALQSPDGTHNLDLFSATANVTNGSIFTLSDSAAGLVPPITVSAPIALSGSYRATDYVPGLDNFPGTGPGTNYISAGDGTSRSGTGNFLNTFGLIAGTNLNGTWKLYIANQASPFPSGTIASWTLSFTLTNAPATTTTLDPPSPNPAFTSGANSLVTLTAHVNKSDLSGPATNGSVVFHDNLLNQDVATNAVDASGTAVAGYTFTNEGVHTLLATFVGGTGFAPSLPSATVTETVVNHTVIIINGEVATVSNPGPITITTNSNPNLENVTIPYPSLIYVGTNGASSLPGIIQKLTITLNSLNYHSPDDLGLMLVAPNGHAYEFMSFAGGGNSPNTVSLTLDDNSPSQLSHSASLTTGTFKPGSFDDQVTSPGPYPVPAPQTFDAAPLYGTSTLASEFAGMVPNGTWKLFLANRFFGPTGVLGSWALNFTIMPPDLSITYSQPDTFCQGEIGAQYSLTVHNALGAPTGGDVAATVTNTLPAGLTPTAASGPTWNCVISNQTVICTQTNPTAAGTSYPPITVTFNVATSAPASLTNTATVSGSMDNTPGNDTINVPTTTSPMPSASITPLPANPCPNSTGNQASAPVGAATYSWSITNGSITSPASLRIITYTAGPSGSVGLTVQVANAASCIATNSLDVPILVDNTPPTITCSSNITVTAVGHCPVTVNFNVSGSDNCTLSSLVATPASGSAFPVGTNTVTVVATDGSGNTNNCAFKVTVLPGPAPQLAAVLSGTNVVLSWPAAAGCYALQSTPALLSPPASNLWTTYAGPLVTNGGSIFVTNGASLASQFYRLAY